MQKVLRIISAIVAPVPYPAALGYHAIVGAALTWALRGAPRSYSLSAVGWSILISVAVGAVLVAVTETLSQRSK